MNSPKHIHMYLAFWAPDLLAVLQAKQSPCVAVCDYAGSSADMTVIAADVTCPACRETFLNGLATGNGVKLTWGEYCASLKDKPPIKTLKERAAEASWTTGQDAEAFDVDIPETGWTTTPTAPVGSPDGWTAPTHKPQPTSSPAPGAPVWDGWGSDPWKK